MALAILCILLAAGCIYLLRRKKPSKGVRALLILATVLLLLTGCGTGQARAAEPPAPTPLP